jgi:competence protein ComEA
VRSLARILLVSFACLAGCDDGAQRPAPPAPTATFAPLDLNTATTKQLEALPAIGIKHARSIIASRNARGGRFQRLEDLQAIDGIGPKTNEAIRPYVVLGP